jgi:hypothetical protein
MKKSLVLIFLFCSSGVAQSPRIVAPADLGNLVARVIQPLVRTELQDCEPGHDQLPFYYGGETTFVLPSQLQRCLRILAKDSFPSRNPYQDGYRGRIVTLNYLVVQDSIARVSATYLDIKGPYPQFRNYGRGAAVEFRKRRDKWVETDRVEGVT